jgi:predicted kinase
MTHVQVLIGTVAAGKSTYSKDCAALGSIIINDDAIVQAVHGGSYVLYRKELKPLYKAVENQILTSAITLKRAVVVDRGTNLTRNSRMRWIGLEKSLDVPVIGITFPFESKNTHAARRVASDSRGWDFDYWHNVVHKHFEMYEPPKLDEGFDRIIEVKGWRDIKELNTIYEVLDYLDNKQ